MPLFKTMKGRWALIKRDKSLSAIERQMLVMADGVTKREKIIDKLGHESEAIVALANLLQKGYVSNHPQSDSDPDLTMLDDGSMEPTQPAGLEMKRNQWAKTSPLIFPPGSTVAKPASYEDFQDTE